MMARLSRGIDGSAQRFCIAHGASINRFLAQATENVVHRNPTGSIGVEDRFARPQGTEHLTVRHNYDPPAAVAGTWGRFGSRRGPLLRNEVHAILVGGSPWTDARNGTVNQPGPTWQSKLAGRPFRVHNWPPMGAQSPLATMEPFNDGDEFQVY